MGIGTCVIVGCAAIASTLFIARWLILRAVKFTKIEEDVLSKEEEADEYFEYENKPIYKR